MQIHRVCILVSLLCTLPGRVSAQEKLLTEFYDIEQGLSHSVIQSLATDEAGNLWIANLNGLQRYNGSDFSTFFFGQSIYSVSCQGMDVYYTNLKKEIRVLHYDGFTYTDQLVVTPRYPNEDFTLVSEGKRLWAVSKRGVLLLVDPLKKTMRRIPLSEKVDWVYQMIYADSAVFIAHQYGIARVSMADTVYKVSEHPIGRVLGMCAKDHRLYAVCDNMSLLQLGTADLRPLAKPVKLNFMEKSGTGLITEARLGAATNNRIYVASDLGFGVFDLAANTWTPSVFHLLSGQSSNPPHTYDVLTDNQNNVWFGCDIGMFKHNLVSEAFENFYLNIPGMSRSLLRVRCIREIEKGRYWLGVENQGLFEVTKITKGEFKVRSLAHLVRGSVNCIVKDSKGRIWVGSNERIFVLDSRGTVAKPTPAGGDAIWTIKEIGGYMHFLYRENGISRVNLKTLQEERKTPYPGKWGTHLCWSLEQDSGYFLMCTTTGMLCLDTATMQYIEPARYSVMINTLRKERVWACKKIERNKFIVTTQSNGVFMFDLEKNTVQHVFKNYGGFFGIILKDNIAWLTFDKGLIRFDYNTMAFRIYTTTVGLINNQLAYMGSSLSADGNLLICGTSGFSIIDLKHLQIPRGRDRLSVHMQELPTQKTFELQEGQYLELPYTKNNFSLNFALTSFDNHLHDRYSWKLTGRDQEWSVPSSHRFISYSNLPPGNYTFQVKVLSHNLENYPVISALYINIVPPFWKTGWFIAAALATAILLSALLLHLWLRNLRHKHRKEQNLLETQVMALRSQINPHFMFNALNSIQHYIFSNKKEDANHYISKLSSLIRITLDFTSRHTITIAEEIAYLTNYLEMEKMRYESRLNWDLSVDPKLNLKKDIPSLMVQPFVENAIVHGISPLEKGGLLFVGFRKQGQYLEVMVQDNGPGIQEKAQGAKQSKGISLIEERMKYINRQYNTEGSIKIHSDSNGTIVYITIPILHQYVTI